MMMDKQKTIGKHLMDTENVPENKKKNLLAQIWSFFSPAIICGVIVVLVQNFIIFYATVPTGSMKNLIQEHSFILANRLAYRAEEIQRGDVIVFEQGDKFLVKRVIGIGGDEVELRGGNVYLNGTELDESAYVLGDTYALNGRTVFQVPEGCVLVFGDNRNNSSDSRMWKEPYVSESNVRGRVFCAFSFVDWYFKVV